jgi:hypothetical protein
MKTDEMETAGAADSMHEQSGRECGVREGLRLDMARPGL